MRRLLFLLALALPTPALAQAEAVDGDTIRIGGALVRLAGVDAPELRRPRCLREAARAREARDRLAQLITGPLRVEKLRAPDRYGRVLAVVRDARGRDLGQVLIAEGLAVPYQGRGPRQDWCPA